MILDWGGQDDGTRIGKMFGVLVVKNSNGELGYLCAVSGKLAEKNQHALFVPPVFDILLEDGFFKKGEAILNEINARIEKLEGAEAYIQARENGLLGKNLMEEELQKIKFNNNSQREQRRAKRLALESNLQGEELRICLAALDKESADDSYLLKRTTRAWKQKLEVLEKELSLFQNEIEALKLERKKRSAALQDEIFKHYTFVNKELEHRSLGEIFPKDGRPIAGAGECAAPKLFQYAFLNQMEPVALAEFWWGESPSTVVRQHGHFYPACRGKCEPILNFMLQGIPMEANPQLVNPASGKELEIVWEDEHMVIINKPAEFLSVPGKNVEDSVLTRLKSMYPDATGPIVVHRLDMSTSGLLLAAKNDEMYKELQRQFLERVVKKRYVAELEGVIAASDGWIDLPLRVDLEDRPRQMVCHEHGKSARTKYQVLAIAHGRTRVHMWPITGRTHQLRVHAASKLGLNTPMVGDDLYGQKAHRLHLHAEWIQFIHPVTKKVMEFEVQADF